MRDQPMLLAAFGLAEALHGGELLLMNNPQFWDEPLEQED